MSLTMSLRTVRNAALAISVLASLSTATATEEQRAKPRTVSVQGTAEIRVEPDQALLRFGVMSSAKEIAAAKTENDGRIRQILKIATDAGVDANDVQTSEIRVQPIFAQTPEGRVVQAKVDGYEMSRGVTLLLRDIRKFESLLTALLNGGVNQFDGISLLSSQMQRLRSDARGLALKAARDKAEAMVSAAQELLGRPLEINEATGGPGWGIALANRMEVQSGGDADLLDSRGTFAAGQITVSASVSVTYEILSREELERGERERANLKSPK